MKLKSFEESCEDMTKLIESCWDENNPDDGLTFDERLAEKIKDITGQDRLVLDEVIEW